MHKLGGSCWEADTEPWLQVLLELIQTKLNYVVQEAIVVIKDIFRRYPNKCASASSTSGKSCYASHDLHASWGMSGHHQTELCGAALLMHKRQTARLSTD